MNMFTPTQLHLLTTALACFAEEGFQTATMRRIASRAGVSLGLAYRYFPSKEALVLTLYRQLAEQLAERVVDLSAGTMAERFAFLMDAKLDLIEPHRDTLLALFSLALDPSHRLGVLGPHTAAIRNRVSGLFAAAVLGASDAPADAERFSRLLYGAHLALILVWTQDRSEHASATRRAAALAATSLGSLAPMLAFLPGANGAMSQVDSIFQDLLQSSEAAGPSARARAIALRLLRTRRVLDGVDAAPSEAALAVHLPLIEGAIRADEPLHLVLPAFPAKAPSPTKTLGALPDLAEQLALDHLQALVDDLAELHPPGARLTICSDGLVFADVVGVADAQVETYRRALHKRIEHTELDAFDLRDVYPKQSDAEARAHLLADWSEPAEVFRERAKTSPALARMVDGIHRFLLEDALGLHPDWTRSQARKRTRDDAYEVVRRSQAWSKLVATWFPGAIRLSIHPQPDVSDKIGVHLLPVDDVWLTPWHGVALLDEHGARLVTRSQAELLGARLVDGSHYERLP